MADIPGCDYFINTAVPVCPISFVPFKSKSKSEDFRTESRTSKGK